MKFYIAGLGFTDKNATHKERIEAITEALPKIVATAKSSLGEEVITLIVMHEHALTPKAISNQEKKDCLTTLQATIKPFSNIILIPGSFSAYEKIGDLKSKDEKIKKIKNNYENLKNESRYSKSVDFYYQMFRFSDNQVMKNLDKNVCLQNSSYLLINDQKKIKHKKCTPINENNKLIEAEIYSGHVFDIGTDQAVKQIKLGKHEFSLGILICSEYWYLDLLDYPLIEVIISDAIKLDFQKKNFFGAILIHVDSLSDLNVYFKKDHAKQNLIEAFKAQYYSLETAKKLDNDSTLHP